MIKAIIFDYDGVIVDSLEQAVEKDNLMFALYGKSLRVNADMIRAVWGEGWRKLYTNLMGFSEDEIIEASAVRKELGHSVRFPDVFPGMPEVLQTLAARFSLYIISSSDADNIHQVLKSHNLDQYIARIFGQNTLGDVYKPNPEYLLRPLAEEGLSVGEALSIGDSVDDLQMSQAAGVSVIACTWGWQEYKDLEREKPEALARSPQELLNAINHLTAPPSSSAVKNSYV